MPARNAARDTSECAAGMVRFTTSAMPESLSIGSAIERIVQVVRGRMADGLILDLIELQDARVRYLLEVDFPFVTFGRIELFSEHPWFDVDNEFASWQSTDALLRDGCRRIAMVDGDMGYTFVRQRVRGYERALREHGIEPDPALRARGRARPDRRGCAGDRLCAAFGNPDRPLCRDAGPCVAFFA